MRTNNRAIALRLWRCAFIIGLLVFATPSLTSVRAQQPFKPSLETDMAVSQVLKLPGKVLAQGKNDQPTGDLLLRTYLVEEIALARPMRVEISGLTTEVSRGWRVTITGGPFQVRAMPAMVWIGDTLLGIGQESPDLLRISVVTFDRSLLRDGAVIAVSYGENDPSRSELPERLALPGNR